MLWSWAKGLKPEVWAAVIAVVAFAVYTGVVYRAGGAGPRADLRALQTSIKQAQEQHAKAERQRTAAHNAVIEEKDNERKEAVARVSHSWAEFVAGLHDARSRAADSAKSIPVVTNRCDNATGNAAVSAAVSEFSRETRAAVGDFVEETARELEQADLNTDQLIRLQAALARLREANAAP